MKNQENCIEYKLNNEQESEWPWRSACDVVSSEEDDLFGYEPEKPCSIFGYLEKIVSYVKDIKYFFKDYDEYE